MRRSSLALAALAVLLAAAPARAQTGNQTDIPLVPPPGGFGAARDELGPGARLENELWARPDLFRSARVGCAVRQAARAYADSVASVPRDAAARAVDALLLTGADAGGIAAALGRGSAPGSEGERAARALADALGGLLRLPDGCSGQREDFAEAEQWNRAVRAYARFIDGAPDALFAPAPPPELLALHQALTDVLRRVLAGARRG